MTESGRGDLGADRAEIAELAAAYARAVDAQDAAAVADLFVPAGLVILPPELAGRDGVTELPAGVAVVAPLARFEGTRHEVHGQRAEIGPQTATAVTSGAAHHFYRRDGALRDSALELTYQDSFLRTDRGWRFVRRELTVASAHDSPLFAPNQTPPG